MENQHKENEKMKANEDHSIKRKHEASLESSEKRCKSTDDTFGVKIKLENIEYNKKKEQGVTNKQIANRSNVKTNNMEESNKIIFTSSPCHITESTLIIDLDDYPDDIQETPLQQNCTSAKYSFADLTHDSDIFELLIEGNPISKTTENEAPIVKKNVDEVKVSDQNYDGEHSKINESKPEDVLQNSRDFHAPLELVEVKYDLPENLVDVKPFDELIIIEDNDDPIENLKKIEYSDFATFFVNDFRYYNYVENSVYEFGIKSNNSSSDAENMYSELFESRKLIFERISKKMYDYFEKHEILNFDCQKLVNEISKTYVTNYNTKIPHFKILRFLHNIILTWKNPSNNFIKMFCNNISYTMLLFNEENDKDNNGRSNSITSEALASNSASTPHSVAGAQTSSDLNQQVEQNLNANHTIISPRPIEQLLANPSISLLPSRESQSTNNFENKSKQSDPHSQDPKTLYPSTQTPQFASRNSGVLPLSYEGYLAYLNNFPASTIQNQIPQNVPRTSQYRLPANNANILTNPSPTLQKNLAHPNKPNLDTFYTRSAGFYREQPGTQSGQRLSQYGTPPKTATDGLMENFVNTNRHGHNLENRTQLQQEQLRLQAAHQGTLRDSNSPSQIETERIELNVEAFNDAAINVPHGTSIYLWKAKPVTPKEKRFKCEICDFKSAYKASVKTHAKTHMAKKLLSCDYCDFTSERKICLNKHLKTHIRT